MNQVAAAHDAYFHVRIVIGMVTGLGLTRLLGGLARFVQNPGRAQIYPVHLGWTIYLLLAVMHFWWFEFALGGVTIWTFELYFFLIAFASLFFFIAAVLYPDSLQDFDGYEAYFHARQRWFYGLLIALIVADTLDSRFKGAEYFQSLGTLYLLRQAAMIGLALVAMRVADRRFHAAFVLVAIALQVGWILWRYQVLS
jgi:hypothetical protein